MRRIPLLAGVLAVAIGAPAAAQSSAPVTRDDSLALGRTYVRWIYENQVDSLWTRLDERLRGMIGTKESLSKDNDELTISFGVETAVVEETASASEGNLVYTREVKFESRPEESMVWRFTIAPDGMIKDAKFRPKGQMPGEPQKADSAAAKPTD